jgi:hypothetical protein
MDEARSRRFLTLVANLTFVLGLLNIFRLIPELFALPENQPTFRTVVWMLWDFVLGGIGVVAGFALIMDQAWAPFICVALWGAWVADSAYFFCWFLHRVHAIAGIPGLDAYSNALLPRVAFDAIAILVGPWACWIVVFGTQGTPSSRLEMCFGLAAGLLGGAAALISITVGV